MKSSIKNVLHITALLMAMLGGAWLLMADSTECSGDDNEPLCEKCSSSYTLNPALCTQCADQVCFSTCVEQDDPSACAERYNACVEGGADSDACGDEALCFGADNEALCLKCGPVLSVDSTELCEACPDRACVEACASESSVTDCVAAYGECQENGFDSESCRLNANP